MAVTGKGSPGSLGDAAAAAPAAAAAAPAAAATGAASAAPAPAAAGLHPRGPTESSAIFLSSVRPHGREERRPRRRQLLWACVRGYVCAPGRARQPRRPAPPESRAAGGGRDRAGRGPREGRMGGVLGQPPARERAWLPGHCRRRCCASSGAAGGRLLLGAGHRHSSHRRLPATIPARQRLADSLPAPELRDVGSRGLRVGF